MHWQVGKIYIVYNCCGRFYPVWERFHFPLSFCAFCLFEISRSGHNLRQQRKLPPLSLASHRPASETDGISATLQELLHFKMASDPTFHSWNRAQVQPGSFPFLQLLNFKANLFDLNWKNNVTAFTITWYAAKHCLCWHEHCIEKALLTRPLSEMPWRLEDTEKSTWEQLFSWSYTHKSIFRQLNTTTITSTGDLKKEKEKKKTSVGSCSAQHSWKIRPRLSGF